MRTISDIARDVKQTDYILSERMRGTNLREQIEKFGYSIPEELLEMDVSQLRERQSTLAVEMEQAHG